MCVYINIYIYIQFWGNSSQSWVIFVESLLYIATTHRWFVSCQCMLQSISSSAGGERCSEPPRQPRSSCGGFPTDQAGRHSLSYPQEPVSLRQLRAAQPSLKASPRFSITGRPCVCAHLSGWWRVFCQAVNNTSGGVESGHCQSGVDVRAKGMTWQSRCFVNNMLDGVLFEL